MNNKPKSNLPHKTQQRIFIERILIILGIGLIIFLTIIIFRLHAFNQLVKTTEEQATPFVTITKAEHGPAYETIVLPGNVQAWHETTIYARTNGYIKRWLVDIGAHVKEGDLLAEIESPEVDAQLRQAEADLKTAEANNALAEITAKRWVALLKTDSVSKQETDEKVNAAKVSEALVAAMRANRDRLRELVDFKYVTAPFDGVITFRYIDVGSLINAGSNTSAPLFHMVQTNPLRIYVKVPQNYAKRITPGLVVALHVSQHPGKTFPAKLIETAKAIDVTTRTLLTQFITENSNYEIFPGDFTEVHFTIPTPQDVVRLSVNTLIFRAQGLQVATLDKNNRVVLKNITISRDFGNFVEVSSGINPEDIIILNPPDVLFNGQKVRVVAPK